jgi:Spy/CpxP family protein refolding chaperone
MFRSGSLEGPPAPAIMRDSIEVTGKELQQYTQRYDSHMAATKAVRDSLRSTMQAARAAFEKGDRSEARSRHDTVEHQWKQLADQDKKFEDDLKNVLTKDQQNRYQQWKDRRRQEAHEEWRQQRSAARRDGEGIRHDSTGTRGQPSDAGKGLTK